MSLFPNDLVLSQDKFKSLFTLEKGNVVVAGGKRAGQTAGLVRYTAMAGKQGRDHLIELGYGTVPARAKKPKDYPLLLPKLDSQLGRFNIDGNTNNILILKFCETEDRRLRFREFRNFNAPCAIAVDPDRNAKLALAVLEIAQLRIQDILDNKLDVKQDPDMLVKLIHRAIEMRAGHALKAAI